MNITLRQEFSYIFSSKIFIIGLILFGILIGFGSVQAVNTKNDSVAQFQEVKKLYKTSTEFKKDIKKPYRFTQKSNGTNQVDTSVDNVARYSYENLVIADSQLTVMGFPKYILKYYGLIFLPLIMGLFGISVATYDYKYDTYKRRLNNYTWKEILLGKYVVLLLTIIASYLFISLLSVVVGLFLAKFSVPFDVPQYGNFHAEMSFSSFAVVFSILCFIGLMVALVWFTLAINIKNTVVCVIAFLVYDLIVPNLGKYDYKNVVMTLYTTVGQQNILQPTPVIQISSWTAWIMFLCYTACLGLGGLGLFYKKLRYL
ncbi:ABC transporter permease subunit [Lactococcus nasutitermitis]|uniref:ABC transporter permease subunit n=1 Tax=Lactococcus nasutitermitis TaxID=1652957 RepID=A0ABV9JB11_9LACT|nr:ABC transporter permease subunit [Lactococcus nasutitermitis]